ncbi:ABC transporter permease [bacterium]|nr:ABC transporter permease [bacterium]
MFQNYLKIALRNLLKHKLFSFINIAGLAVGMTSCLLIVLYVWDEVSYEAQHEKADRIFRLNCEYFLPKNAGSEAYAVTGPGVAPLIVKDYPEIESIVRLRRLQDNLIQKPNTTERFYESIVYADSTLFDVFTLPLLSGNASTALDNPYSIIISKAMAHKYFGNEDVVGKTLTLPMDTVNFTIMGVLDDPAKPSHLQFDFIASFSTLRNFHFNLTGWWNFSYHTFVLLKPETDVAAFAEKIKDISHRYIPEQEKMSGYSQDYSLINLKNIHLDSHLRTEFSVNGKRIYVYTFFGIGILILLIACINFMNLSTARSLIRAKEVGVRKVVGAFRSQLIRQFLTESLVITTLALVMCIIFAEMALPWLNQLADKQLTLNLTRNPLVVAAVAFIVLLTGFGAGMYPAVFLSSFAPISVLKSFRNSSKGAFLRKSLVTFQFSISIGLIAGIVLVHNQIQFMREAELGFSKDQVVVIPIRETSSLSLFQTLQKELEKIPDVVETSVASKVPGKEMGNNVVRLGWDDQAAWSDMRFLSVDHDYQKLYDLELIEGRWFDRQFPADEEQSFVINESAVARLGFASPSAAIGQPLQWQRKKGRVIGVLKDFHFMSLQNAIEPFIVVMANGHFSENLSIKVSTQNYHAIVDQIKTVYESVLPGRIFEYQFLDEDFDQLYRAEDHFNSILLVFTGLAIFVACLGLLGLISYTAQQRTKEIGIRKVMGATVGNIVFLICRDFMKLVVLAMVVATPLAYYSINLWLQDFPYRTDVALWVFPFAGLLAVALAFLTISFQAIKAAVANPVQSLKYE